MRLLGLQVIHLLANRQCGKSTPMNLDDFFGVRRFLYRIVLALAFVGLGASTYGQNGAGIDETARLLAGLPMTAGPLAPFTQSSAWQTHAAALDKAWKTKEFFKLCFA